MPAPGEQLGVLGGTFDPPHVAHLVAAVWARAELRLDRVLLVVAGEPWQKVGERAVSPAADRVAMTRLLVEGVAGVEVSTLEADRSGPSYTVETLEELRRADPGGSCHLIVGRDLVGTLDTWERHAELPALADLAVVDRPGEDAPLPGPPWRSSRVEIPQLAVSSSDLRARVAAGLPIEGLVPPPVASYIHRHRLYGGRP